jgi:hypothetical protein
LFPIFPYEEAKGIGKGSRGQGAKGSRGGQKASILRRPATEDKLSVTRRVQGAEGSRGQGIESIATIELLGFVEFIELIKG